MIRNRIAPIIFTLLIALVFVFSLVLFQGTSDSRAGEDSTIYLPFIPRQTGIDNPRLSVAHLALFAMDPNTAVTVTIDGAPVLTDFEYGDSTDGYVEILSGAGTYLVEIFPAGSATPAITGTVDLAQGSEYTAIAIGDGVNQALELKALLDDNSAPASGNFKLRLGHLAPFASGSATADIRLQDGTPVLLNVDYGDIDNYMELAAGIYDIKITTPGGATTLIDPLPVTFNDGDIVSAFATGEGSNQPLGTFALPSGQVGSFLPLAP